jgi:hypothetical protein
MADLFAEAWATRSKRHCSMACAGNPSRPCSSQQVAIKLSCQRWSQPPHSGLKPSADNVARETSFRSSRAVKRCSPDGPDVDSRLHGRVRYSSRSCHLHKRRHRKRCQRRRACLGIWLRFGIAQEIGLLTSVPWGEKENSVAVRASCSCSRACRSVRLSSQSGR